MGGEDNLHVGIQFADKADKALLPLYMEGYFGFVHEEHSPAIILHKHCEKYNEHLFFARRELIGIERIAILFEKDLIALADDSLARLAKEFIDKVLEFSLGL